MKLYSWNVNGIRAIIKKGFIDFLERQRPDVLSLQEIKIGEEARAKEQFDFLDYDEYWNSAKRPGYSGTMTLVKKGIKVNYFKVYKWDDEGRVQVLEFDNFFLVNVYFPNANPELSRLNFKMKFNDKLLRNIKKLEQAKPVVICGDYNVAHQEIDLARPKQNVGSPGFTNEERAWMTKFLKKGFVDIFREQNKNKIQYTWWSYRANARANNVGWRIDYFSCSEKFFSKVKKSYILDKEMGSDHCPIGIDLK